MKTKKTKTKTKTKRTTKTTHHKVNWWKGTAFATLLELPV
jgi:hypothetical protein